MLKSVLTRLKRLETLTPTNTDNIEVLGMVIDIDDNGDNANKYYIKYVGSDAEQSISEQEYIKLIKQEPTPINFDVEIIDD